MAPQAPRTVQLMKGNLAKPHCTLGGLHIAYKDIWCVINLSIRESTGGRPPSLPMGALATGPRAGASHPAAGEPAQVQPYEVWWAAMSYHKGLHSMHEADATRCWSRNQAGGCPLRRAWAPCAATPRVGQSQARARAPPSKACCQRTTRLLGNNLESLVWHACISLALHSILSVSLARPARYSRHQLQ